MEPFCISKEGWYDDVIDTVGYFKRQIKGITKEKYQVMGPNGYWIYIDKA